MKMLSMKQRLLLTIGLLTTPLIYADITVPMYLTAKNGQGAAIGTVVAKETPKGVLLIPHLKGLPPGMHGFHVHQFASCANEGMAAGEHFDPAKTGKHLGPYGKGHLGDLPKLTVNKNGEANSPVLAPHLQINELKGHSLMIHAGGDNYSDIPKAGGGGARIACGVIP